MADNAIKKQSRGFIPFIGSSILIFLFFYVFSIDSISIKSPQTVIVGETMGTTYSIVIRNSYIEDEETIKNEVDSILNIINNSMSTYIDNSEISLFNKNKENKPVAISEHFYSVLQKSSYYYNLSDKKFDPTINPLYELWGFRSDRFLDEPTEEDVIKTMDFVGFDKIVIDQDFQTIFKKNKEVSLDFSAIAKGYAVDVISEHLASKEYLNHFVEIGGEIRTASNNEKWLIGIQNPFGDQSVNIVSALNKAIATSGNYVNYIEYLDTGSIKTHIIDPITGFPLDIKDGSISSATVISNNCIDADALATILMLLDINSGVKLIETLTDSEAFIIYIKDGKLKTRQTSGFEKYIQ